jgi:hypothetical protein
MPGPRFQHGCAHDVFVSYTHADNHVDPAGWRWITKFTQDLHARLEGVSGRSVNIWRDEEKLGAADRFDDSIARAIHDSAVLLVVLSPTYFNSQPCRQERESFYQKIAAEGRDSVAGKARVVKVAKFWVPLDIYPADLRPLLEHQFYAPGTPPKEFHLSPDEAVRRQYPSKVDDVAQEVAGLLAALEAPRETKAAVQPAADAKGVVYLAEGTSDVEPDRVKLRRQLTQLGFDVQPTQELRLLPARELRSTVAALIQRAQLVVHPVGGFYGFAPEGGEGKSLVEIQLEISQADARNGDLSRIIWMPDDLVVQEDRQKSFLDRIRTVFAGRGFDLLERPFRVLEARVSDRLRPREPATAGGAAARPGVYLICDKADRALAKSVRSFIFMQRWPIEWTPIGLDDLDASTEHQRLLARNHGHLVLHGQTSEAWLQDRIRELDASRHSGTPRVQAIFVSDPERPDKEDILVHDVDVLRGYSAEAIGASIQPFLQALEKAARA